MHDAIRSSAGRPMLLIAAGDVADEATVAEFLESALGLAPAGDGAGQP